MRIVFVGALFLSLALPVFSQDANTQRYQALSDNMGTIVSSSNTKLQDFDQRIGYNWNGKVYNSFKQRFETINRALQESENRLSRLLQSHANSDNVKAERERYDGLIKHLQEVKAEYDEWLKSVS
jgi:DNA repair exonuclease SbcCD ATPase subunit